MSCQRNAGKITVPDELRDILLEFTISYLLEQPVDILDYAIGFFVQLRENRQTQLIQATAQTCSSTPDESVDEGERASGAERIFIRDATSHPVQYTSRDRATRIWLLGGFHCAVNDIASIRNFHLTFLLGLKSDRSSE